MFKRDVHRREVEVTSCLPSPGIRLPGCMHCPVQTSLSYFLSIPAAGLTKASQCKHSGAVSKKKYEILSSSSFTLLHSSVSSPAFCVSTHCFCMVTEVEILVNDFQDSKAEKANYNRHKETSQKDGSVKGQERKSWGM